MPVSAKVGEYMERSSWIRRMFEDGARMKAEHGADNVFDFSLGNPNLEPPDEFDNVLQELARERTRGAHGYMANAGYPETREAVAATVSAEQGVEVPGSHVVMTCGAGGALNVIFKAIFDPGDELVVPKPHFVEYGFYCDNHGGVLKSVRTASDFSLDLAALEEGIGPRTRAVLINSPNNPTGRVYPQESLRVLGELLDRKSREYDRVIYLISDEPYRHIVYDGIEIPSVLLPYENSIIASSYSKDLSLAGERIGYIAVHPEAQGSDRLMGGLVLANRILGFVNAPALMQRAVARLQEASVDVDFYRRNRDMLYGALTDAGFSVPMPEGAFYLFPKSPIEDDVAFSQELQEKLVLVVPGSGFFGPGYFRVSYCVAPETVEGSLAAFAEVGRKYFG